MLGGVVTSPADDRLLVSLLSPFFSPGKLPVTPDETVGTELLLGILAAALGFPPATGGEKKEAE